MNWHMQRKDLKRPLIEKTLQRELLVVVEGRKGRVHVRCFRVADNGDSSGTLRCLPDLNSKKKNQGSLGVSLSGVGSDDGTGVGSKREVSDGGFQAGSSGRVYSSALEVVAYHEFILIVTIIYAVGLVGGKGVQVKIQCISFVV
jgi:hypothetical protein